MPDFVIASAHGGGGLAPSWAAPAINTPEDDILLIGLLQVTPRRTIDEPGGWTNRVQLDNATDDIRMAILDRTIATASSPYDDVFGVTGGTCYWSMAQLAFRSLGSVPANTGSAIAGPFADGGAVVTRSVTASYGDAPTPGNVLVAYFVETTYSGVGGGTGIGIPDGWALLESVPGTAQIGHATAYYKVADGSEEDVEFELNGAHTRTMSLLLAEYPIDVDAPPPAPEAWDIFDAADLLGSPVATLENAKGRFIRSALHDLGEGGFMINRHADEATEDVLAEGNMVKVRIPDCGPDYLDGFFLGADGDYTLLSMRGGPGKEDLTFKGPGALSYLDRALMLPCMFSVDTTVDTWAKQWATTVVPEPVGTAWVSADPDYLYAIGRKTRRIYKIRMSDRVIVKTGPVLWSGSTNYAAGLSADPDDDSILWALEGPWQTGSSNHTKVRKIDRATLKVIATTDLGSAIKHSAIKAGSTALWLSRYDGTTSVYKRSKTNPATVLDSGSVTYKGTVQSKAVGISVNGTELAVWFAGTARALVTSVSAPFTVTRAISTRTITAFGGDWFTSGGEQYFAMDSYSAGKIWLYQLTDNTPLCADSGGVLHPEQTSPGALAWRVLIEITHEDRPVLECPELSFDFTEDEDSDGTPWPARTSTEEFTWRVGEPAFSGVLARLIPAGVTFDLDVNTMTLHAYVDSSFGTNRTSETFAAGKVRFEEGVNLGVNADFLRRDNRGQPATYVTVAGDNGRYGSATLSGRYVRGGFLQVTGPTTGAVLDAIGDDELARQRLVADALGFETLWASSPLAGRYIPKRHYWKGDLVTVDMEPGEFSYQEASLRIYGTLISERDGGWRSALELGSRYKIPPAIASVPGRDGSSSDGGGASGGATTPTVINVPTLSVQDDEDDPDVVIPRVTTLVAKGAYSPSEGVAVLPHPEPDGVASGAETALDHGTMGAAETIDVSEGGWHRGTLDDDCTITVEGFTVDEGLVALVKITEDSGGGNGITWSGVLMAGDDQPDTTADAVSWFLLWSDEGDPAVYGIKVGAPAAAALTVLDEGSPLATAATSIDFVGAGVSAAGAGAAKTVTIPGTPTGAAGGDLTGTYPNPGVADDSHAHTAATLPAGSDTGPTATAFWRPVGDGVGGVLTDGATGEIIMGYGPA